MGAVTHGTLSCGCPTSSSPLPNASMHRLKYRAPGITGDIVRKLGALGTVSPIMLRISVAKIVADAITDKEDQTLIDLMRAVDIIYQITKIRVFEMSEDLKMNPGESELAFALRIAVNQIATGQSKIVTPADMEPFDHSMNEMMEQARRLLYQGPYILTCA